MANKRLNGTAANSADFRLTEGGNKCSLCWIIKDEQPRACTRTLPNMVSAHVHHAHGYSLWPPVRPYHHLFTRSISCTITLCFSHRTYNYVLPTDTYI